MYVSAEYTVAGMKGKLPSGDRMRLAVAEWVGSNRKNTILDDVIVEHALRTELEDDPRIAANAKWEKILAYLKTREYYASGVAMHAIEQLHPLSVFVYERQSEGLKLKRTEEQDFDSWHGVPRQSMHMQALGSLI